MSLSPDGGKAGAFNVTSVAASTREATEKGQV
jgi:hypothetical protein